MFYWALPDHTERSVRIQDFSDTNKDNVARCLKKKDTPSDIIHFLSQDQLSFQDIILFKGGRVVTADSVTKKDIIIKTNQELSNCLVSGEMQL